MELPAKVGHLSFAQCRRHSVEEEPRSWPRRRNRLHLPPFSQLKHPLSLAALLLFLLPVEDPRLYERVEEGTEPTPTKRP